MSRPDYSHYPPQVQRVLRARTRATGWVEMKLVATINGFEIRRRAGRLEAGTFRYVVNDANGRRRFRTMKLAEAEGWCRGQGEKP